MLKQKSAAEFFAENKNISGFDNAGKSLYTTMRELVENALDSAEAVPVTPSIEITLEDVPRSQLNALQGLQDHKRVDAELFRDYETDKDRDKRLAKEAKDKDKETKAVAKAEAAGKAYKPAAVGGAAGAALVPKGGGAAQYYRFTCRDNGTGMPHEQIPEMLGRVLAGTKYGMKQTRGKFGLGAKMALIWSKMSTGLPIEVESATAGSSTISHYVLDIDIPRNAPNVLHESKKPNPDGWRGAKLSLTIEGNHSTYKV